MTIALSLAQDSGWRTLPAETWNGGQALFGCRGTPFDGFWHVDIENSEARKDLVVAWSGGTNAALPADGSFKLQNAVKAVEYKQDGPDQRWRLKISGSANDVPVQIDLNISVTGEQSPTATFRIRQGNVLRNEMNCSVMPTLPGPKS